MKEQYLVSHQCKNENGEAEYRFIGIYNTETDAQNAIDNAKEKDGFCNYSIKCFVITKCITDDNNWNNGFLDADDTDTNILNTNEQATDSVNSTNNINVFQFNGYEFEIYGCSLDIEIIDEEIWLSPELNASYDNENDELDHALCDIRLYFNGCFNTKLKDIKELKGKKFTCSSNMPNDCEDIALLYVLEHEEVEEGTLEIINVTDTQITYRWHGTGDVYWNDEFGSNVPFDGTGIADITI